MAWNKYPTKGVDSDFFLFPPGVLVDEASRTKEKGSKSHEFFHKKYLIQTNDTLVCSWEEVMGSNPTIPLIFAKCFRSIFGTFDELLPIGTSYTVLYTIFQGTSSVKFFYELIMVKH